MPSNQPNSSPVGGQDLTGRTLGNYLLLRRLGRGGMANVYLAKQTTLNRSVAIKVLKSELAVDHSYVARFHREAQAAAALSQANIVQIIEIGEIDGIHFIAQEYVRGQNLRQYLNRNKVVEPILAVNIIRQVAAALQVSSKQAIVHRDIKPENIMITSTGEVKVTDFGLARVLDDQRADLTQIGITMGTPLYMSPEQAEGRAVDVRSDLYSLGITAWHMFTGHPPFEGENALSIAVKHVKEEIPPLNKIRPDLPMELCDLIHKLTNKKPEDRFQSPALLIKQLRTLEFDDIADWDQLTEKLAVRDEHMDGGDMTMPQSRLEVTRQLETIMSGHFRPWWKSPWLMVAMGSMLLAGGLGGLVYSWTKPPSDPLARFDGQGHVQRFQSSKEQFLAALTNPWGGNTTREEQEEFWKSVEKFYPEDAYYCGLASLNLGAFYLDFEDDDEPDLQKTTRLGKARKVFEPLAQNSDDLEFQVAGQAGLAITMSEIQAINGDLSTESEIGFLLKQVKSNDPTTIENEFIRNRVIGLIDSYFVSPGSN